MPYATLDRVPAPPFDRLPVSIEQISSRTSAPLMVLLLVPALVTLMVPVGLLAAFAAPALWAATEHPAAAAQVAGGLGIWTALFVLPAKRIIQRLGAARQVQIADGLVIVRDTWAWRSKVWMAPLSEFSGIAHHVRSTLSGVRHELVLVHRQRRKSVRLHAGEKIPHATIERAAALLGLPHVPAGELYRFGAARQPALTSPPALAKPLAA